MSQAQRVLNVLRTGSSLTSLDALKDLSIISFPKRICELEKDGYIINSVRVAVKNRFKEKVTVNSYKMLNKFQIVKDSKYN